MTKEQNPPPKNELVEKIDAQTVADFKPSARNPNHIRPSELGHPCARKVFYDFWWVSKPDIPPAENIRKMRRGLREEKIILNEVAHGLGIHIHQRDPHGNQYYYEELDGLIYGRIDGLTDLDPTLTVNGHVPPPDECNTVVEVKNTNNARFRSLMRTGLDSEIEWYSQVQLYIDGLEVDNALFVATNADTQEYYLEIVERDNLTIENLLDRAERIIAKDRLPERLAKGSYQCKFCRHFEVCWGDDWPRENCRTCVQHIFTSGVNQTCRKYNNEGHLIEDFEPHRYLHSDTDDNGCRFYYLDEVFLKENWKRGGADIWTRKPKTKSDKTELFISRDIGTKSANYRKKKERENGRSKEKNCTSSN